MSYIALGQYSQTQQQQGDHYQQLADRCTAGLKDTDWDSKAGREQGVKLGAECAGKGACMYLTSGAAPPAVLDMCGSVARKIVGPVIDTWNDVFGNADEWKREYERRARSAADRVARLQTAQAMGDMAFAFETAATRIIDLNDKLIPEERGKLGGGRKSVLTHTFADGSTTATAYYLHPGIEPAKALIARLGSVATVRRAIVDALGPGTGTTYRLDPPQIETVRASTVNAWITNFVIPFFESVKRGEALAAVHVTARAAAWDQARKHAVIGTNKMRQAAERGKKATAMMNTMLIVLGATSLYLAWRRA